MSVNGIAHNILKEATGLQVAVYRYLEFEADDTTGTAIIIDAAKKISALARKLKKEDEDWK